MKKMYSIILFSLLLAGVNSHVSAQETLASWNFELDETTDPVTVTPEAAGNISVDHYGTNPLPSAVTVTNITVTPLTKSQGLLDAIAESPTPPTTTSAKWIYAAWGARGFDVTIPEGTTTDTWGEEEWVNARVGEDKYITFSITPDKGYKISYTQIPAHIVRSFNSTSPTRICYQYNIAGENNYKTITTQSLGTSNSGGRDVSAINLSAITDLQGQSKKVTFRIVLYNLNATGAGAAGFYRSTLSVTGTVAEDIAGEEDLIAYWDFTKATGSANIIKYGSNALAPTASAPGVTVEALTRSTALEATTAAYSGNELTRPVWGWRGLSSSNIATIPTGAANFPDKYDDMVDDEKYVTFSITPNTGSTLSLSGIDAFTATGSATTVRMRMEYKIGDGEFTVFGIRQGDATDDLVLSTSTGGVESKEVDFTEIAALQNIAAGTMVTFRIVSIINVNSEATAETAWGGFFDTNFIIRGTLTHAITFASSDDEQGTVSHNYPGDLTSVPSGTEIEITATPETGYKFSQWSDGNTDNPRILTVTEATSLIALFVVNTPTGIESSKVDKGAIVSVEYYNLTGKRVPADTKGLVLKKITYEDGSVETVKQLVN